MKQVHLLGLQNHETDDRILAGDEATRGAEALFTAGREIFEGVRIQIVDEVVMPGAGFQRFRIRG